MGPIDRYSWSSDDAVWLVVVWSGTGAGSRLLVMPNEESVVVNPRIFVRSSHDTFCNFTSEDLSAGFIQPIDIGFNKSVSLMFSHNDTELVFNVWTREKAEDYDPEDVSMSIADATAFWEEVAVVCTGFGAVAGLAAIKVRSKT